jgi:RHS repeat-associated protein
MVMAETNRNKQAFKFGGKELDMMNGLNWYDFVARGYDPVVGRFLTPDLLAEKYPGLSPYAYCMNNPVNAVDRDGRLVIFINGMHAGTGGTGEYWRNGRNFFDLDVMEHLNDHSPLYRDGSVGGRSNVVNNTSAKYRHMAGYNQGWDDLDGILKQVLDDNGNIKETIKIITHSMGAVYAKGYIQAIIQRMKMDGYSDEFIKNLMEFEADFAPYQPKKQKANSNVPTFQFSHSGDWVAGNAQMDGANYMDTSSDQKQTHSINDFWSQVQNLPTGNYTIVNGQIVPN